MANMKRLKVLLLVMAAFLSIACAASATACPRNSIPEASLLDNTPSNISASNTGLATGFTDIHTIFRHTHSKFKMPLNPANEATTGASLTPCHQDNNGGGPRHCSVVL
jgi:hypothetical protein